MVKKESRKVGLHKEDAQNRKKWKDGVTMVQESVTFCKRENADLNKINDDDDQCIFE